MADQTDWKKLNWVFEAWWKDVCKPGPDGAQGSDADRAELAQLRRIKADGDQLDIAGALTIKAFRDLRRMAVKVCGEPDKVDDFENRLCLAAVTLAQIRRNVPGKTVAELLGGKEDDDRVMKEARFLRLMRADTLADLFAQGRRLAALLDRTAPVGDLGASLFLWCDYPDVRRNWARDYYHLDQSGQEAVEPESLHTGA